MADEETLDERFLRTFHVLAEGQARRLVSAEELVRELSMDPDGETDKARFLGTAPRGGGVRDSQQDRPRGARLHEPLVDTRRHPGGRGEQAVIVPVGSRGEATAVPLLPPSSGPTQAGATPRVTFHTLLSGEQVELRVAF